MSHLFSQGAVSSDLLVTSTTFRDESLAKLRIAAEEKAGEGGADFLLQFRLFERGSLIPGEHRIVFTILDKRWEGRTLSEGLSFFIRVNLRRTV